MVCFISSCRSIVLSYFEVLHALLTSMLLVNGLLIHNFEKYTFNQEIIVEGHKASHVNCNRKNIFNISVA